jgi:hypothetical protein
MLDHYALDWDTIASATYHIEQRFRYEYPGPIFDLSHRLVVLPPAVHADQRAALRLAHRLPHAPPHSRDDALRQRSRHLLVWSGSRRIRNRSRRRPCAEAGPRANTRSPSKHANSRVSRERPADPRRPRDRGARKPAPALALFVRPRSRRGDRGASCTANWLYAKGVTDVETTRCRRFRTEARRLSGFCARRARASRGRAVLPARYVSGHLLGEGATHAWIEFLLPGRDGRAVALSLRPHLRRAHLLALRRRCRRPRLRRRSPDVGRVPRPLCGNPRRPHARARARRGLPLASPLPLANWTGSANPEPRGSRRLTWSHPPWSLGS